jgi:hypothetical protein
MRPRPDILETTAFVAGLLITLGALLVERAAFGEFDFSYFKNSWNLLNSLAVLHGGAAK